MLSIVAAVATIGTLGCGGGGAGTGATGGSVAPGFYRGTVTYGQNRYFLPDEEPIVGSVASPTSFGWHSTDSGFSASGQSATVIIRGAIAISGTLSSQAQDGELSFSLSNEGSTVLTGTMRVASMPVLGRDSMAPAAGDFSGPWLLFAAGGVAGTGNILTAVVSADHSFVINTGEFTVIGTFGPDHAIENGLIIAAGIAVQETTSQYSFDGTTLILRLDQLPLEPETDWFTLTRD
jgi:hypothetical protein